MFTGSILLFALMMVPDDADTIRSERIDEVIITSNSARQRLQSVQAGAEQLQLKELTTAPQLFGETDIMRSIQLLPGIKAESDASSSFQVRGGTSAQNMVLSTTVLSITSAIWRGSSPLSTTTPWLVPRSTKDSCQHNMAEPHRPFSISADGQATNNNGTEEPPSVCCRQKEPSKVLS